MGSFRLLPTAERDLEDIYRYTARTWSVAQASRYLDGLQRAFGNLADLPGIGTKVAPEAGVRVWSHEKHRIFYRRIDGGVEIGLVLHQARQIDRVLELWAGPEESSGGSSNG